MSYFDEFEREPWRFDVLDLMRRIERTLGETSGEQDATTQRSARPRLGDSSARRDETIRLRGREVGLSFGQDPWMQFPASTVGEVVWRPAPPPESLKSDVAAEFKSGPPMPEPDRVHIVTKFLGLLGGQGPLPLAATEEAQGWLHEGDAAFVHFLDIFNNRFQQLFFRAWADARAVAQHDRPDRDRFNAYVNSTIGVGSPAFADLKSMPRGVSLYAGLLGARAKSASRLSSAIAGFFVVEVEIDQFQGAWLALEPSELSKLGASNSRLGDDLLIGAAAFSVQDKIRIRLFVDSMERYRRFLPKQEDSLRLVDLLFFYVGDELAWEAQLALPAKLATPVRLGVCGELGWTSWMSPNYELDEYRSDARFEPAEWARRARERRQSAEGTSAS